ncbi:DMT family transporter [Emcibacter sp. SYSU 3D8]|uniref:DMT family transporter n=1 Tax=Emcibacter sp. SYSU 3D8 TaxID=3133969 RepID=UPI0031FF10DF
MSSRAMPIESKPMSAPRPGWRRHLWHAGLLVALALMWGSSFLMVKISLRDFTPVEALAGRMLIAALFFTAALLIRHKRVERGRKVWLLMAAMGVIGNVTPYLLINWGQTRVETGTAAILMGIVPLVTAMLAQAFVRGERFHLWKAIGIAVGFAGIVVLFGGLQLSGGEGAAWGAAAILLAALGLASGTILADKASDFHSIPVGFGVMWIAALVSVPIWLADSGGALPEQVSWPPVAAVFGLAIFSTALPTLVLIYLVRTAGPTFAGFTNYLVPVIGVVLGITFLNEPLTWNAVVALGLIIGGIVVGQIGGRRGKKA